MARPTTNRSKLSTGASRIFRLVGGRLRRDDATAHALERPSVAAATESVSPPISERIRVLAYDKWTQAGCPPGDGVSFWLEAERELASNHTRGN